MQNDNSLPLTRDPLERGYEVNAERKRPPTGLIHFSAGLAERVDGAFNHSQDPVDVDGEGPPPCSRSAAAARGATTSPSSRVIAS